MTIKAVLQGGRIQLLEPLPLDWVDGQELLIEPPGSEGQESTIRQWAQDLEAAAAKMPVEEHDRFHKALDEIERESKESVRREWSL